MAESALDDRAPLIDGSEASRMPATRLVRCMLAGVEEGLAIYYCGSLGAQRCARCIYEVSTRGKARSVYSHLAFLNVASDESKSSRLWWGV